MNNLITTGTDEILYYNATVKVCAIYIFLLFSTLTGNVYWKTLCICIAR